VLLTGCQAPRDRLTAAEPLERARAVVALADAGDTAAVQELVNLLEDPDRAVRMYAILGLVRLCGKDYGYKYYGTDVERAAAVGRWRDALRAGEVVVRIRPSGVTGEEMPGESTKTSGDDPPAAGTASENGSS